MSSVCVLKPSVCSEIFCDSWPKAVYQLGDHLMDDVGGKSVYVACIGRLVEHFTDVTLPEFLYYLAFLRTEWTK